MLELDGQTLTIPVLAEAVKGRKVGLHAEGYERMAASSALVEKLTKKQTPIYGVTTGLGARAVEALDAKSREDFPMKTLRGRAHAIGEEESVENVRAGLLVRFNTLLGGYSGARVSLAEHIAACLNAGLTPVVGQIGSIGVSDLVVNATIGLALTGEGRMRKSDREGDAAQMMQADGIAPLKLAPRDGLALANHSCATIGAAALAWIKAEIAFESAQTAAALSLEGFRANLSPLQPDALAAKPLPGQSGAANDLVRRLAGTKLLEAGQARRLQDPLSLRNTAQIHGGVHQALSQARMIIEIELNGTSDNPIAIAQKEEVISCGAYHTTELGLACEAAGRAFVHLSMAQIARLAKLLDPKFSDLPVFLAKPDSGSNGFAPLMKTAEAVAAEIAHAAQPPAIWPSVNANGVEDCLSTAPVAVRALSRVADMSSKLTAIELMVASQAIELRGCQDQLGPFVAQTWEKVRNLSPVLAEDRPLSDDVMSIADAIRLGEFR